MADTVFRNAFFIIICVVIRYIFIFCRALTALVINERANWSDLWEVSVETVRGSNLFMFDVFKMQLREVRDTS